ncbi:putative zinc-binding metallopeptidase [Hoylesella shahii]|uniref:zinc-binding metallopeptidase n=1 Tax=Hoylesella shahii TaxID=228603 RepID=UPI0028E4DA2A|nr:putative zinc-binding metallopeptidase [Hoylesella shahii]
MKKILIALLAIVALGFASCSEDNPSSESIFAKKAVHRDNFDKWLLNSYTYPYNIDVKYKMEDIYSDMKYHLVPADSAKAAKLSIIAKYLWFDAYAECVGPNFVKANVPRIIHLIGSPAFNSGQGTMVLGTAEGGLVITLYMVNNLTDKMLTDYATVNDYYFHTMHHEFTHILNQKIPYDENFQHISEGNYVSGDWYQKRTSAANKKGFVTPYAMSEPLEDFAEMLSVYVTTSPSGWQKIMDTAGTTGAPFIQAKLDVVRAYMKASWKLDIDELRSIVLRRASEINHLDLNQLK